MWERAPWADVLYGCDSAFWRLEECRALRFEGLKVSGEETEFSVVRFVPARGGGRELDPATGKMVPAKHVGLSDDPCFTVAGRNGGYQAVGLAAHLGAGAAALLGYDMRLGPGGARHSHPDHPAPLNNPAAAQLAGWAREFRTMVPDLARRGLAVVNCTPGSAIDCFPRAAIDEVLRKTAPRPTERAPR